MSSPDPRIQLAIRLLEDAHFVFPTAALLAAHVGLSQFYFSRRFKAVTGLTVSDFVNGIRMRQAAFRLRTNDEPIAVMHTDFGYASHVAFTHAFTNFHGLSPTAFRESARLLDARSEAMSAVTVAFTPGRYCWIKRYRGGVERRKEHWEDFLSYLPYGVKLNSQYIGLSHDDPRTTPPSQQRYDCGMVLSENRAVEIPTPMIGQGVELFLTTEGFYATSSFIGPSLEIMSKGYRSLIAGWLPKQTRYRMAGEPIVEIYARHVLPDAETIDVTIGVKVRRSEGTIDWTAGRDQRLAAEILSSALEGAPDDKAP